MRVRAARDAHARAVGVAAPTAIATPRRFTAPTATPATAAGATASCLLLRGAALLLLLLNTARGEGRHAAAPSRPAGRVTDTCIADCIAAGGGQAECA